MTTSNNMHTPGPWRCNASTTHDAVYYVWDGHGNFLSRDDAEHEANARLIAAAPDFKAAAERLLAVFDQQKMTNAERIIAGISEAGLRTEGNAAIETLRAAIAKAEGRHDV